MRDKIRHKTRPFKTRRNNNMKRVIDLHYCMMLDGHRSRHIARVCIFCVRSQHLCMSLSSRGCDRRCLFCSTYWPDSDQCLSEPERALTLESSHAVCMFLATIILYTLYLTRASYHNIGRLQHRYNILFELWLTMTERNAIKTKDFSGKREAWRQRSVEVLTTRSTMKRSETKTRSTRWERRHLTDEYI